MCPGPSAGFAPLFPGDTRAAPRASTADAPGHSGGLKWGNSQVGASALILILVPVQAKPPWRVWQRWLRCWSQEWEVQEQGCTSHIPRSCPGPTCPQTLFNHPGFFMKEMSSKAKHNQKNQAPSNPKVWKSPAGQNPGLMGSVECPQSSARVPRHSLALVPCLVPPASPSLGSFPGHSRQHTSCSANLAWAYPPRVYNTTLNLQQKLSSLKPVSLWQHKLWMFLKSEASQLDGDLNSLPQSFWSLQIKRWKISCQSQAASNYTKTDKFFHQPTWIAWLD